MKNQEQRKNPKFLIQVGGAAGGTVRAEAYSEDFIEGTPEHLNNVADVIDTASETFVQRLMGMASKPTGCSIEFGVNVGGEAGIPFVTKGTIGANFKVVVSWEQNKVN